MFPGDPGKELLKVRFRKMLNSCKCSTLDSQGANPEYNAYNITAWRSGLSRLAHNQKNACSNQAAVTILKSND